MKQGHALSRCINKHALVSCTPIIMTSRRDRMRAVDARTDIGVVVSEQRVDHSDQVGLQLRCLAE